MDTRTYADPYPIRIVTFIDILGFARDVMKLDGNNLGFYVSIDAVLRRIAKCKHDLDNARATRGVWFDARMTQFSDCVLMSYENAPGASLRALADAAFIGQAILRPGYLPRGAITLGPLVHDDVVAFGGALVRAYQLESKVVDVPRIHITDEVMALVRRDLSAEQPNDSEAMFVRNRGTGPFVHILGEHWPFIGKMKAEVAAGTHATDGIKEMYEELRDALPVRYRDAPDHRSRAKNEWIRDYVNDTIKELGYDESLKVKLPRQNLVQQIVQHLRC